jgi:hypothetical protein
MKQANQLIQDFLRTQDRSAFIDLASPIFDKQARLPKDLFVGDGLHPSAKLYAMWASIIKPILMKRFAPSRSSAQFSPPRGSPRAANANVPVAQ